MRFEIGFYHFDDGTEGFIYDELQGDAERVDFEDGYFIATSESVKRFMEEPQPAEPNQAEMILKMWSF